MLQISNIFIAIIFSFSLSAVTLDSIHISGNFIGKVDSQYVYVKDQYGQKIGLDRKYIEQIYFIKYKKKKKLFLKGKIEISIPKDKTKYK